MGMESNKIFAALLTAGIIAYFAGIGAKVFVHPEVSGHDAYVIEAAESDTSATTSSKPAGPEPVTDLLASADMERGRKKSKVCAACHTFNQGGKHLVGPNLAGIVGAPLAAKSGFVYSSALKEKGGKWDVEALNEFLWKPKKTIPGTKMVFAGMKKPEDRAAMIKWLQSQK